MKKPVYVNIDINSVTTPYLNKMAGEKQITEETLYSYMDQYANTGVTDILIDIFCQYSATDSEVWTTYADKYLQKTENGLDVDYTDRYKGLYTFNKVYSIDPHVVWFKRCREIGINPWITIRMNDCHCPDDDACFLRSDYFYEAREKGLMVGDQYGYFRYCFDYGHEEIREKMLRYIEEQINRYDVYGIELDFQREIVCFDYLNNENCCEIMNGFIRDAVAVIKKAEKVHGHKIKIAVRLQRDLEQNKIYGFDARTWDKEGLVDIIVVTPRWETCDSDMPIETWKASLKNTEIVVGIETLVSQPPYIAHASSAHVRGMMSKYIQQGSEGTYLFNYFVLPWEKSVRCHETFNTCSDTDLIMSLPQRHALTFQDIAPEGCERWKLLPADIENGMFEFEMNTGMLPQGKNLAFVVGLEMGAEKDISVEIDGAVFDSFEEVDPFDLPEINSEQPCEGVWNNTSVKYYRATAGKTGDAEKYNVKISSRDVKVRIAAFEIDVF